MQNQRPATSDQRPITDLVTLVNESDEVMGSMDKVEAHRGEAQRHRAISVYLFNNTKELLIQQRSANKIVGANQWANTVCGNVRPSETYEQCAYRRLKEELGITQVEIKPLYKFEYHLRANKEFSEWEIDQVFVGFYDGEVSPNPDEAQNFSWVNWEYLVVSSKSSVTNKDDFNTKKIELTTDQQQLCTITLAPWFVWMLRDKELQKKLEDYVTK